LIVPANRLAEPLHDEPKNTSGDSRAASRHRRALLTGATGVAARATSMGVAIITVPLTLHYLGNERFGLWMTISSVVAMASFADFGIGNGVLNTVAEACGRDDVAGIRRAISSGFAILSAIGMMLLALFLACYRFASWGDLFRVSSNHGRAEAGPAMLAFAVCFTLNIPLDIVQRVQLGLQEGFRPNVWQICSSVASLLGILCVLHLHLGVPALVLVFAGTPVAGVTLNALYFFGIKRRDLVPRWNLVSREAITQITSLGGMFFLIQVVVAISFSADNFIIARTLGVATVSFYSIPQRMFSVISVMLFTMVTPLWPAYGEAVSRGDLPWVRRTLRHTLLGTFAVSGAVSVTLLLLAHRILLLWVGPSIHPAFMLLLGLAVWEIVRSVIGTLQMFLNGASILRFQTITHCIFGIACLTAKFWCAHAFGIAGVPWAGIATYGLFIVLPNAWYVPRLLKRMVARHESTSLGGYSEGF
jgi:O-antigen/teichoic acid export membrane protein